MKKLLTIVTLIIGGCVQNFDPEIDTSAAPPIVIEAFISTELKQHSVSILQAQPLDALNDPEPLSSARIHVEDLSGGIYEYEFSSEEGIYHSCEAFAGVIDQSYRIIIELEEETFESDYQAIPSTASPSNLSAQFSTRTVQSETGEIETKPFVDFSIDIDNRPDQPYYRFDWSATYEAQTPLQGSSACWAAGQNPPMNLDPLTICYVSETGQEFLSIFSSEGLSGQQNTATVFSVDPNRRFQRKYSPEVVVYSINPSAYEFWEDILNQTQNVGGLFDEPVGPIAGNIHATNSSEKRVIGVFEVASVVRQRAFFLPSILSTDLTNYEGLCADTPEEPPFACCECTFLPDSRDVAPDFWQ